MDLGGLQRTTLSDFPGRVACTVFAAGCNLRCPYCHNPELIDGAPSLPEAEFFGFLEERRDVLDGVVISGGEPTMQPDLPAFIERIIERGLDVKLDTNGTRPEMLQSVLDTVDYVAMDVKTRPGRYDELGAAVGAAVARSARLLRNSDVECEFRTTFDPGVVAPADFEPIAALLGDEQLVVQSVRTDGVLAPDRVETTPDRPVETAQRMVENERVDVTSRRHGE